MRKSTVYKIVAVIILVLLAYRLWKTYTHLPPTPPLQYPADYSPNTRVPPDVTVFTIIFKHIALDGDQVTQLDENAPALPMHGTGKGSRGRITRLPDQAGSRRKELVG